MDLGRGPNDDWDCMVMVGGNGSISEKSYLSKTGKCPSMWFLLTYYYFFSLVKPFHDIFHKILKSLVLVSAQSLGNMFGTKPLSPPITLLETVTLCKLFNKVLKKN